MKPNLKYEAFHRLKDYELFKKVHAIGETEEDISPENLYLDSVKEK